jgi:hypothetical protein
MSERDYLGFVIWALAFMITVGGLIQDLWPSLIQFVDRMFLKQPDSQGH